VNKDPGGTKIPTWLVVVGGVPLLLVMLMEFITVIGRNSGIMVYGSIEIVQAAILLSSATAIVLATLNRSHAKVHFLLNRSSGRTGRALKIFNALCATLFFLGLTVGGVWIALDMWGLKERSELLGIPYAPLRWFAAACTLATCWLYLRRILAGGSNNG
jgi:TRAP-type C4-dicarboxylate transport system permease small subunit